MIDEIKTFEKFGYRIENLTPQSHKQIIAACSECGKFRVIEFRAYTELCTSCCKRGSRNKNYKKVNSKICVVCGKPYRTGGISAQKLSRFCSQECYGVWSSRNLVKERHHRYKGCPQKQNYYCIDCKTSKISYSNFLYGNCRCRKCAKLGKLNNNYNNHKLAGANNPCFGKCGKEHPAYTNGNSSLNQLIRRTLEYKKWRFDIFQRDNFICTGCGDVSKGNLEAHHKKEFHVILEEFLNHYSNFSTIEDKETLVRLSTTWKEFWNTDNGTTLCVDCHKLTRVKNRR